MEKNIQSVLDYLQTLQDESCQQLEQMDGSAKFGTDSWQRPEGGGGQTRVLQNGASVNRSV